MRRIKQHVDHETALKWLIDGNTGILSLQDEDGYPYTLPLNYVVVDKVIYFHCAMKGRKVELIQHNTKASFCVVESDQVLPATFSTSYGSVVAKVNAFIIKDDLLKRKVLAALCLKYAKDYMHLVKDEIDNSVNHCMIVGLTIIELNAKISKERLDHEFSKRS